MAKDNARKKLLDLLDRKAFDPVLNASPDDYDSEAKKKKLQDVQKTTQSTKKSYHEGYDTAHDVAVNFHRDLNSDAAQDVHNDLRDLGLPTLPQIKDEFDKLADQLGVETS